MVKVTYSSKNETEFQKAHSHSINGNVSFIYGSLRTGMCEFFYLNIMFMTVSEWNKGLS